MRSDEDLMISIQQGSSEAFEALYRRFRSRVYGYLAKKVTGDDRDEVFQMVFLKLHEKSHLFRSDLPFTPWFFTLIRNTVIDFYRSQKIDYVALEGEALEAFESSGNETKGFNLREGRPSLAALNIEDQQLLYEKFVEGHGYKELEVQFGMKAATLRKRVSRLIKKLRNKEGLS